MHRNLVTVPQFVDDGIETTAVMTLGQCYPRLRMHLWSQHWSHALRYLVKIGQIVGWYFKSIFWRTLLEWLSHLASLHSRWFATFIGKQAHTYTRWEKDWKLGKMELGLKFCGRMLIWDGKPTWTNGRELFSLLKPHTWELHTRRAQIPFAGIEAFHEQARQSLKKMPW